MSWYLILLIILAVTVLPFVLARAFAKATRLPSDLGWRLGLILASIACGVAVLYAGWPPKYGIDLRGGVILVYEVDESKTGRDAAASEDPDAPEGGDETAVPGGEQDQLNFDVHDLVGALSQRLNQGGVEDMVIRPYGDRQVEIIVPDVTDAEIERLKKRITQTGFLMFRIVANSTQHGQLMAAAEQPSQIGNREVRSDDGRVLGEWIEIGMVEDKEGQMVPRVGWTEGLNKTRTNAKGEIEILMATDIYNVQGMHLQSVRSGFDEYGNPCVEFSMTMKGSRLFGFLTGDNLPNPDTGQESLLGIIMDDELISAPRLETRITGQGRITGRFSTEEVEDLVAVLQAGKLPAVLREDPISETKVSPLLGSDTIEKGRTAIGLSLISVLVFMIIYYRFAGLVAAFALLTNLLLIFALVTVIRASLTLPGLAGLVLTVGMSVDANVLIFERIREELSRGSALRLAIRNGFGRATTTIVDANVTTLITAIVLYGIGTDQIKGFAVILILGILISMFTAIYCARAIFETGERLKWISRLSMMRILNAPGWNIIGKRKFAAVVSCIVIAVGVAGVIYRGKQVLDTDFNGGTRVQIAFTESIPIEEVREKVSAMADSFVVYHLDSPQRDPETEYMIDTDEEDIDLLKQKIQEAFQDDAGKTLLQCHNLEVEAPSAYTASPETDREASTTGAAEVTDESFLDAGSAAESEAESTPADPGNNAAEPDDDTSGQFTPPRRTDLPPDTVLAQGPTLQLPGLTLGQADAASTEIPTEDPEPADQFGDSETAAQETAAAGNLSLRSQSRVDYDEPVKQELLEEQLLEAAEKLGMAAPTIQVEPADRDVSAAADAEEDETSTAWLVRTTATPEQMSSLLDELEQRVEQTPIWLSSSKIGSRVAGDMRNKAIAALLVSLIGIVTYIWIRFHRVVYGLAAVVALIHDVLITVGAVAASVWLAQVFDFLLIEEFKISLPMVAAFLTIIGYSLNDTIVVFDRIREVKGRSPELTEEIINTSINQTLSRTLLTSITTLIVVLILYCLGGQGIHGFAFALLVGVIVGTYSSVFVASPMLLWLSKQKLFQ